MSLRIMSDQNPLWYITGINEINESTWCVNAMHGMSANNDGTTKMCCMIKKEYNRFSKDIDTQWALNKTSLLENFNNPHANGIRENLKNGILDSNCELCWSEERAGRKSKRMRDNNRYNYELSEGITKPLNGLAKIELNLGNTCNIKCRTCHPTISSMWMKESYDLNPLNQTFKVYSDKMKKYHQTYDEESAFWPDLINNLPTIKQFDFYGGEPFLSQKMWEVLRICVERGYAADIELHYNTNGTTWPKETELWKNFKSVNISFSIDGINDRFEYVRFPANWNTVKENMDKARQFHKQYKNLFISWCITISNLNIFYLRETLDEYYANWSDFGMYLNLVHNPLHFNISRMPTHIKECIIQEIKTIPSNYEQAWHHIPGVISFMEAGLPDATLWNTFLEVTKQSDDYRKQDFYKTFTEFTNIF